MKMSTGVLKAAGTMFASIMRRIKPASMCRALPAVISVLVLCSCNCVKDSSCPQKQTADAKSTQGSFTNLGIAVKSTFTVKALFATNELNERVLYGTTRSGEFCRLYRFNTVTKKVDLVVPMEKAKGAWAIAKDQDNIYVGTYLPSSLYKYDIKNKVLTEIATFDKEGYVWTFKIYGRDLYIGTYPTASLYKYNLDSGKVTDLGQMSTEKYIRAIEAYNGKIYLGIGAKAQLIEYDPETKKSVSILPKEYAGESFAYNLVTIGDKMFVGLSPSNKILMYDFKSKEFTLMNVASCRPPTFSADSIIFYGYLGATYEFNTKANTLTRLVTNEGLQEAAIFDNKLYAGVDGNGFYREFSLDGKLLSSTNLSQSGLPPSPAMPFSITAFDNRVFIGERQLRVYDLSNKLDSTVCVTGEPKAMSYVNGTLYTADYTSARIWGFPPKALANPAADDFTSEKAYHLFDIGHEQNRPLDMDYNISKTMLAIGTEPEYGQYGGALTLYDIGTKGITVFKNLVDRQSIRSVCFDTAEDRIVYAGTSTFGGTGTDAMKNESAHLVKFDTAGKSVIFDVVPESGNSMIVKIASAGDNLYITTDTGTLYAIDAASGLIINKKTADSKIQLVLYTIDGKLYAATKTCLYLVDQQTLDLSVVKDGFKNILFLVQDDKTGTIYIVDEYILWSYKY